MEIFRTKFEPRRSYNDLIYLTHAHRFTTRFNFHVFDSVAASFNDKDDPRQQNDAESITAEKIIKSSSLGDLTALKRIRPTYEDLIQASALLYKIF